MERVAAEGCAEDVYRAHTVILPAVRAKISTPRFDSLKTHSYCLTTQSERKPPSQASSGHSARRHANTEFEHCRNA